MSSLAEIQEAIEKLTSEERAKLREWFDAQDAEETDELLAAIDEGIRSAETEAHLQSNIVRIESWCEERSRSFSEFVICSRI